MAQPNILFIMTDQQRWDAMGCSGGWVRTPNLDRIAAEGVRFPNCVTNSPVCIPARVSLATGLYPHNTGIWDNLGYDMPKDTPTWMQAVRDAGYRTSVFGKTHLHHHSGDLRAREHQLHAYGLDDVDEIGGPRASARVLSHMTARWQKAGLWDAYQQDYADRFKNVRQDRERNHMTITTPVLTALIAAAVSLAGALLSLSSSVSPAFDRQRQHGSLRRRSRSVICMINSLPIDVSTRRFSASVGSGNHRA